MKDVPRPLEPDGLHRSYAFPRAPPASPARKPSLSHGSAASPLHRTARCRAVPMSSLTAKERSGSHAWRTRPNAVASRPQPGHVAPPDYPSSGIIAQSCAGSTITSRALPVHFESVIAAMFARTSISRDNASAGRHSGGQRDLELEATAEETMSPIARRPMPSSLPPAA